jgi:hypothetical protein
MTGGIEIKGITHFSNDNKFLQGNAEIYATTLVDAKVRAGGSIYIYGSPKQINKETLLEDYHRK